MTNLIETYANTWASMAISNLQREFPSSYLVIAENLDDVTQSLVPSQAHPVFYGSYDFHSSVEMHWLLVTLLRTTRSFSVAHQAEELLYHRLAAQNMAEEIRFFENPHYYSWERPYGWGWLFQLAHALLTWDSSHGRLWFSAMAPLITLLTERLIDWLANSPYPIRHGLHPNTAFSLDLLWPWASTQSPELHRAISDAIARWFLEDTRSTYGKEPSGSDFLSPTLSEATLLTHYLDRDAYVFWLDHFVDGDQLRNLAKPVRLNKVFDGQEGHLYGLQLSRSYHLFTIADHLSTNHPYKDWLLKEAEILLQESLPFSCGMNYLLDHWLPAFALRAAIVRESALPSQS